MPPHALDAPYSQLDACVPSVEAIVADQASDAIGLGHIGVHISQPFLVDEALDARRRPPDPDSVYRQCRGFLGPQR